MKMRDILNLMEDASPSPTSNPNVRKWFGASKVVDANNHPLVVHHGTNAHAYDRGNQIRSFNTGGERGAAFFTSNRTLASEYGEKVYGVYLRIENPLIVHGDGKHWESIGHDSRISGNVTDRLRQHHQKHAEEMTELFSDTDLFPDSGGIYASRIHDSDTTVDRHTLKLITGEGPQSTDAIVKVARRFGYDGVIFRNVRDSPTTDKTYRHQESDIYAVFSSSQVKSATDNTGTYSTDISDIGESTRY